MSCSPDTPCDDCGEPTCVDDDCDDYTHLTGHWVMGDTLCDDCVDEGEIRRLLREIDRLRQFGTLDWRPASTPPTKTGWYAVAIMPPKGGTDDVDEWRAKKGFRTAYYRTNFSSELPVTHWAECPAVPRIQTSREPEPMYFEGWRSLGWTQTRPGWWTLFAVQHHGVYDLRIVAGEYDGDGFVLFYPDVQNQIVYYDAGTEGLTLEEAQKRAREVTEEWGMDWSEVQE